MQTIEEAERTVQALTDEAQALTTAKADFEAQLAEVSAKRDAAYIVAERTPTPQHTRQADALEAQARLLEGQVQRKTVALAACRDDLTTARQALEAAQKAATVVELEGLYGELVSIAGALEQNILDAPLWRRVAEICTRGNQLYSQVKPSGAHMGRTIFPDVSLVVNRVLQRVGATLGGAIDVRQRAQHPVEFAATGDAMKLDDVGREIAHLRRVYIDQPAPVQVTPAPMAVAA